MSGPCPNMAPAIVRAHCPIGVALLQTTARLDRPKPQQRPPERLWREMVRRVEEGRKS
jgi:hypothetical protein